MEIQLFAEGCPVCERATVTTHHCVLEGVEYVRCNECGLIYQTGVTNPGIMMEQYTGGTLKHLRRQLLNRFRKIERQRDFDLRMTRARGIFDFAASKASVKTGTYLDIGCNKGFNIYAAEEKGWEAYGNELVEEIQVPIKNSKPHLRKRIKTGSFLDLSHTYADNSFDLITCIDVIEHLLEPKKAMEEMIRIVKPGGVVIYQTCDATDDKVALGGKWLALKPHEHLLLYDQANFKTHAINAGFKRVEFAPEPFEVCDGNFVACCYAD